MEGRRRHQEGNGRGSDAGKSVNLPQKAKEALTHKRYHEWGYRYNNDPRIDNLNTHQKQMIALAEQAEAYLQHEARESARSGSKHNNKAKMRNTSGAREFRQKAKAGAL